MVSKLMGFQNQNLSEFKVYGKTKCLHGDHDLIQNNGDMPCTVIE